MPLKSNVEEDRKTICFVISDEEVFFSKEKLIMYSPYIASLVSDLDPNKVRNFALILNRT